MAPNVDLLLIFAEGLAIVVLAYVLAALLCAPFLYLHYRLTRKGR